MNPKEKDREMDEEKREKSKTKFNYELLIINCETNNFVMVFQFVV